MGKVKIDDIAIDVPDGMNLMKVAELAGIEIPHFCWHPGLSIVAQCRMCLVDIEGVPKVQPACNSFAKDGLIVRTANAKVQEARRAVMEFLLINHPLDCPICDQAGECRLQDNSFGYGQGGSRYTLAKRLYPGFDRTPIGPHVVADMTRCIQCTRCIRFTQEITETSELTFQNRGGKTLVWTHDDAPLDNELSACAADVCPVGALTAKEFRFRARVWWLEKAETVCHGCDVGCNVTVEVKDRIAHRFLPRYNGDVNDWWMCDQGRATVENWNRRDHRAPFARANGQEQPMSAEAALEKMASVLTAANGRAIEILAPGSLPNEALWLAKRLSVRLGDKARVSTWAPPLREQRRVKNRKRWAEGKEEVVNGMGARLLGLAAANGLLTGQSQPAVTVVVDGDLPALAEAETVKALRRAETLIVFARTKSALSDAADLVIPLASPMESAGTVVNGRGRLQKLERAVYELGGNQPAWEVLARVGRALGVEANFGTAEAAFDAMAGAEPAFRGQRRSTIGTTGIPLRSARPLLPGAKPA